uniref:Uncharacterized protein n=1 Tax=Arundo donax TaxID=35708 RepID=A0A0A9E4G1_ARUDO
MKWTHDTVRGNLKSSFWKIHLFMMITVTLKPHHWRMASTAPRVPRPPALPPSSISCRVFSEKEGSGMGGRGGGRWRRGASGQCFYGQERRTAASSPLVYQTYLMVVEEGGSPSCVGRPNVS